MSTAQITMDSLRELNTKLLAVISELRKENTEISELREKLLKFAEVEAEKMELRRELKARTDELEKTITDYSVKIGKLNAVIVKLEKTNAVTTKLESENVELKAEIAKLRYDVNEIKQQTFSQPEMLPEVVVISKEMVSGNGQNNNTIDSNTNTMNSNTNEVLFGNIQISDSVVDHEVGRAVTSGDVPSDNANTESLEDKETDDFLDEVHKKRVSDEIRERKRKKKLQGELIVHESSPAINTSCESDLSMTSTELVPLPEQVVEESIPKESSAESAIPCELKPSGPGNNTPPKKIFYNQKIEQDLICKLLEFNRCHDSISLPNSISSKHIPDVPVNTDLTPGSVPHLAHLFDKAEKTGRKEKLRWYYYSEEYEKKVVALRSENNISD
ncbi:hypothetical protein C1645_817054 [Glomus cerebriforme]|uniref:Uncharacterized protein n=1 Tax=Glomus cerebriforme TaxID=658196 RepID=A0A397TAE2_9GLOM|nr:hypothetical protein C1645_817054 [Glomus cerebriforme]